MMLRRVFPMTGTTPAAAGQAAVSGMLLTGLDKYDFFCFDALLVGATGGTLDVYIQRLVDKNYNSGAGLWLDWIHFPQLGAGASAVDYSVSTVGSTTITKVGQTANDGVTGAPALAANTSVGGHPGDQIRVVAVAGTSTSAGAAITLYVSAFNHLG